MMLQLTKIVRADPVEALIVGMPVDFVADASADAVPRLVDMDYLTANFSTRDYATRQKFIQKLRKQVSMD